MTLLQNSTGLFCFLKKCKKMISLYMLFTRKPTIPTMMELILKHSAYVEESSSRILREFDLLPFFVLTFKVSWRVKEYCFRNRISGVEEKKES